MINYIIDWFKPKKQVIGENTKMRKNKKDLEIELSNSIQVISDLKDELIEVNRELRESGVWHDKYIEQKKVNSDKLELIMKKVDEIFTEVKKTKRVNKRLSKENEQLLAKQLGE